MVGIDGVDGMLVEVGWVVEFGRGTRLKRFARSGKSDVNTASTSKY